MTTYTSEDRRFMVPSTKSSKSKNQAKTPLYYKKKVAARRKASKAARQARRAR